MNILEDSNIFSRTAETVQNGQQLYSAAQIFKNYNRDREKFWWEEEVNIARDLRSRFSLSENPENEIIIPVHKNARDIPPLMKGLSRQNLDRIGPTQLTVLMHNNGTPESIKKRAVTFFRYKKFSRWTSCVQRIRN